MVYIRTVYVIITGIFLYLTLADTSILHFLGIIRIVPYLFVATIVLLSARYMLSWVQKGIFIISILLVGAFVFYAGSISGIGCIDAGYPCIKEINDHLKISMLFFIISAGFLAISPQKSHR